VPQAGSYFGLWGNAASGTNNPLAFPVVSANPTVSSIFGVTPAGQATLVALAEGPGTVDVNPRANLYPTNTSITLTAIPDSGQVFLGWSGDAGGTQNPLTIMLDQSKVITALFAYSPHLSVNRQSLTPQGFRIDLASSTGLAYQLFASSNLTTWESLGTVTNHTGVTNFTDGAATNLPARYYRAVPWP